MDEQLAQLQMLQQQLLQQQLAAMQQALQLQQSGASPAAVAAAAAAAMGSPVRVKRERHASDHDQHGHDGPEAMETDDVFAAHAHGGGSDAEQQQQQQQRSSRRGSAMEQDEDDENGAQAARVKKERFASREDKMEQDEEAEALAQVKRESRPFGAGAFSAASNEEARAADSAATAAAAAADVATLSGSSTASRAGMPELNEDGSLNFFWTDAYEDVSSTSSSLYLFGKVKAPAGPKTFGGFTSCTVEVKENLRCVFLHPRKRLYDLRAQRETDRAVTATNVEDEFENIARKHGIKSWRSKVVLRKHAFAEDLPKNCDIEFVKVIYSAEYPKLPRDLVGETFDRALGTNTSLLENFLLKRDLMGPCWLRLAEVAAPSTSCAWTSYQVH
jgi:hypothetical protein